MLALISIHMLNYLPSHVSWLALIILTVSFTAVLAEPDPWPSQTLGKDPGKSHSLGCEESIQTLLRFLPASEPSLFWYISAKLRMFNPNLGQNIVSPPWPLIITLIKHNDKVRNKMLDSSLQFSYNHFLKCVLRYYYYFQWTWSKCSYKELH